MDHYECVRDIPVTVNARWAKVQIPTLADFEYTGLPQKAAIPESNLYKVISNEGGTDVGTYTVELVLSEPNRYRWSDVSVKTTA